MPRKFAPSVWCLIDTPASMDIWEKMLEILVARKVGVMVRPGEGLDPFLLLPRAIDAGLKTAIYLHLRDTNRVALDSILRSAQALKLHRIFLGDPRPVPGVTPREPISMNRDARSLSCASASSEAKAAASPRRTCVKSRTLVDT